MLPAMTCLGFFSIGTALSRNAQSIFITRFFGGFFGSAAISNVNAALGDIWSREARGTAVTFYGICVVGGPTLGPVVGSAILVNPHMGWRWTEYVAAILTFAVVILTFFYMPEMYPPVLLKRKAERLRKQTGNDKFYHPQERLKLDFKSIVTKQLSRPLKMLVSEPMVACIAFYASFVYAILYLALQVFPIVFEEQRGWSPLVGSLPFLGLFIGIVCAIVINLGNQPRYIRKCRAANGRPVPEARLPPLAIGALLMVIGLFWFGWTAAPKYSWVLPCVAAMFIGAGFNTIFQQCKNLPNGFHDDTDIFRHQLPCRRLWSLRSQCHGSQHLSPEYHGCRTTSRSSTHVSYPWSWPCYVDTWGSCSCHAPSSILVHEIWSRSKETVDFCTSAGCLSLVRVTTHYISTDIPDVEVLREYSYSLGGHVTASRAAPGKYH